jgi:hypothetical protein
MKKFIGVVATLALAAGALGGGAASAQSPQNPPARFAGTVTLNGQVAPAGTTVTAQVAGAACGSTTVFMENGNANYVVDVPAAGTDAPGCGAEGSTVTLLVNGQQAGSGPWRNFELNVVNLNAQTGATPSPTATASPTGTATAVPTPRAPQTGTGLGDSAANETLLALGVVALIVAAGAGAAVAVRRRNQA